ncbi:MAG: biotin carboxylase N-terminal domain-containing protein [Candidatus Sericytochromatia bacterium]|nr:biotin carboxylase N-terminal domain-containing protein [Candidatus Sericytochromatia bacterium]
MRRILVANRGEIALRVIRACRDLGWQAIAIYSDADREAMHVSAADAAWHVPGGYLDGDRVLAIAREAGADGIHPGYGFLAENAAFADQVQAAGLAWVGPNSDAMRRMASKTAARREAEAAGVPIVPGTTSDVRDEAEIIAFGERVGWPVALKAAAGGGGKGFVVVWRPDEAGSALERARREGLNYFKDPEVYLEKYLAEPRHIEIQVLGDKHGRIIHLGERECSIQRRHQKLVEECPSPALDVATRAEMGAAAVRLAQRVGYDSAGTVEFLWSRGAWFFLEMNTRIQVEHAITEEVYDVDLVKAMLEVAFGEAVPAVWEHREPRGWAIECRLNAEDPSARFRPAPGLLVRYVRPAGPGVRVEDAYASGMRIPDQYDSMIAKIVTRGADRSEAIARMRRALAELVVEGVPTTAGLHRMVLGRPEFQEGKVSTHFIGEVLTEADLATLAAPAPAAGEAADEPTARTFAVEVSGQRFEVRVSERGAAAPAASRRVKASKARASARPVGNGSVTAPMHATVTRVDVAAGDAVTAGQRLLVLEAMKMETDVVAPVAGIVAELPVVAGTAVEGGQLLVRIQPGGEA